MTNSLGPLLNLQTRLRCWRWWVLYRPSTVTFPLSLRISKILPLLFFSMPLFPTPPLVSPKFPHVPREQVDRLFATKSESVRLIVVQLVSKFSNFCDHDQPTSQTDWQTDKQTDGWHAIARPRFALVHCAVKMHFYRHVSAATFRKRVFCPMLVDFDN